LSEQTQFKLTFAEVNKVLCEKCRKHLRSLVRDKISEQMVDGVLGEAK